MSRCSQWWGIAKRIKKEKELEKKNSPQSHVCSEGGSLCRPGCLLSPAVSCPHICCPCHLLSLPSIVPAFVVPAICRPCHQSSPCLSSLSFVVHPSHPHCLLSPLSLPFVVPMVRCLCPLLSWRLSSSVFIVGCLSSPIYGCCHHQHLQFPLQAVACKWVGGAM